VLGKKTQGIAVQNVTLHLLSCGNYHKREEAMIKEKEKTISMATSGMIQGLVNLHLHLSPPKMEDGPNENIGPI